MAASPKAILFDLDDTLILDEIITKEAFTAAGQASAQFGADPEQTTREAPLIASSFWQGSPYQQLGERLGIVEAECLWGDFFTPGQPWEGLREWALKFRLRVFGAALRNQGIEREAADQVLADAFAGYRRDNQRLMPEAWETLQKLHPDFKLGLITNGAPDLQREKLAASHMSEFFQAIVVSGEIQTGKPHPEIFHHALHQLGVSPAEAIMVGNSLRRDIVGGAAAGLQTVWLEVPGSEEEADIVPDYSIHRLAELPGVLRGYPG